MNVRRKLTKSEIDDQLSPDQKTRLGELFDLGYVLANCIITGEYRPSDALRAAIHPSPYGNWLLQQSYKREFDIKEARLCCLLNLYYLDVLVDLEKTNPDEVAAEISAEMLGGKLKFAMRYGPELYERAAELFPNERHILSSADTQKLLDTTPIGVFHFGHWLGGPWGIVRTDHIRRVPPSQSTPLQHCHDVTCWKVHKVRLSSDPRAQIIQSRPEISKVLESEGDDPSEFNEVISEVLTNLGAQFDPYSLGEMVALLGDGLSIEESRVVLSELLDGPKAKFVRNQVLKLSGLTGGSEEITASLNRAELLQLILVADDPTIAQALDKVAIAANAEGGKGKIKIPRHEVRRGVLNKQASSAFRCTLEYSGFGLRSVSPSGTPPMRLWSLLSEVYGDFESGQQVAELRWQIRAIAGSSVGASLTEYLRKADPVEVVQKLILNKLENVEKACEYLGIMFDTAWDNPTVTKLILWKLGFPIVDDDDLNADFFRHSERLYRAAESASVSAMLGEEEVAEISTSYFRSLERLLGDTLTFAAWCLTSDHTSSANPFKYIENNDVWKLPQTLLAERLAANGDLPNPDTPLEKWTLQPLCRGFSVLADVLDQYVSRSELYQRPTESTPDFHGKTDLQKFPFVHTVPFLDLTTDAQNKCVSVLRDTNAKLEKSRISGIRNGLLHYRRSSANLESLRHSLEEVESVVKVLQSHGLVRTVYSQVRSEVDRWGRSTHTLVDSFGNERTISRPSVYSWINLPSLNGAQYLVTIAQFDEMGEYIRVRPGAVSEFNSMWAGVPNRRRKSAIPEQTSDQVQASL